MITKLVTLVLIICCAFIVLSDAGRFRSSGSRTSGRGSIFSSSKPKSTSTNSHIYTKPSHTPASTSHGNIGGWNTGGSLSSSTHNQNTFGHSNNFGTQTRPQTTNNNPHLNSGYGTGTQNRVNNPTNYIPPTQYQNHVGTFNTVPKPSHTNQYSHVPSAPRLPTTGQHTPSGPHLPSAPPASHIGWIAPKNTGGTSSSSGHGLNQNAHSGYGTSSHSNHGWSPSQPVTANKNWQTSSQSNSNNYGGVNNANYPRQQYHQPSNSFGTSYHPQSNQPHVVNNFITTNNHQTHYVNPGVSSFSNPSVGYHFVTYRNYPTYYSPFPSYSPVSSFGLGLAVGSSLGHHLHHDYYGYPSNTYHYHNHYSNSNNNGVGNSNGNGYSNTANGNNPNSNNPAPNGNTNLNNFNSNSNQNVQSNQNGTFHDPTQPMAPLVYSISGQTSNDDDDSTEIIFTNPYLIVGVENMIMYGEFQDEQDILIIIEQDADGLDPYPWDPMYSLWHPNSTSV